MSKEQFKQLHKTIKNLQYYQKELNRLLEELHSKYPQVFQYPPKENNTWDDAFCQGIAVLRGAKEQNIIDKDTESSKLYVKGNEQYAIGQEVHTFDRGPNKFYVVSHIENNSVFLTTRTGYLRNRIKVYGPRIVHICDSDKCYFTKSSRKRVDAHKRTTTET